MKIKTRDDLARVLAHALAGSAPGTPDDDLPGEVWERVWTFIKSAENRIEGDPIGELLKESS